MSSRDTPPTPEVDSPANERAVDAFRKERDEAVAELQKVKKDLASVKKMLKQMTDAAEEKEKAKAEKEAHKKDKKKKKKASDTLEPSSATVSASTQLLLRLATPSRKHPRISVDEDDEMDSKEFYALIAEKFPSMKISMVLEAEKKFMQADKNHDGVIDREELDRMLIVGVTVFTPGKVEEILKEIDADNSGTIDFMEALNVMEKLMGNRKINLPDQVKQNQTKVCSIQ